jgi:tRNA(Ser,Leu) C12 N-acetylase TAN1
MKNWNLVITVFQDGFRRAFRALAEFGPVDRSPYHNVLLMAVEAPLALLEAIEQRAAETPALYDAISRVAPATHSFEFGSAAEFDERAKSAVMEWVPRLAGRSFHVRLHRRGLRHDLRSPDAERHLDDALLEALQRAGTPGSISFTDPDAVIAIDTIDDRAGIALWTREDLARHPLLRPD